MSISYYNISLYIVKYYDTYYSLSLSIIYHYRILITLSDDSFWWSHSVSILRFIHTFAWRRGHDTLPKEVRHEFDDGAAGLIVDRIAARLDIPGHPWTFNRKMCRRSIWRYKIMKVKYSYYFFQRYEFFWMSVSLKKTLNMLRFPR